MIMNQNIKCNYNNLAYLYVSSVNGRKLDLLSLFGLSVKKCKNPKTLEMLARMVRNDYYP